MSKVIWFPDDQMFFRIRSIGMCFMRKEGDDTKVTVYNLAGTAMGHYNFHQRVDLAKSWILNLAQMINNELEETPIGDKKKRMLRIENEEIEISDKNQ